MTVAALLDLGADREKLLKALESIPAGGFKTEITRVRKSGLDACDFNVVLDEDHENHDHDMAYLYSHEHPELNELPDHHHEHTHDHHHHDDSHEHHHHSDDHYHEHSHEDHNHSESHHVHRSPEDVYRIIEASDITEGARRIAKRTFEIIARAEAKAHGVELSEVHFHEVGAIDSIVDIIAAAVCIDDIGIDDVIVSPLSEGTGTVRCQHGIIPVPVPAVVNISIEHGLTIKQTQIKGEMITPTGAALMAAVRTSDRLPDEYRIKAVGLGAGKRDYGTSGVVRAMIIEC